MSETANGLYRDRVIGLYKGGHCDGVKLLCFLEIDWPLKDAESWPGGVSTPSAVP